MSTDVREMPWTVLIVDDDPVCLLILERKIQAVLAHARIERCHDKECALELLSRDDCKVDVVCMDEVLGSDSGYNVTKSIRNMIPVQAPVLISVTSHNVRLDDMYDLFWTKPYPSDAAITADLLAELTGRVPLCNQWTETSSDE